MRDVKDFGEYSVKNVKSFMGHEGMGFNCTLYRNGKKIGFCIDDASGGGMHPIDWVNTPSVKASDKEWDKWREWRKSEQKLLDKHLKSLPKVKLEKMELEIDEGWFVTELVNKWELDRDIKKMKKQCSNKILFRHKGCKKNGYMIMNTPFNPLTKARLVKEYGDDVEIFNEVFEKGKIPSVLEL